MQRVAVERLFPSRDDDRRERVADEIGERAALAHETVDAEDQREPGNGDRRHDRQRRGERDEPRAGDRSEEHTSELQSLMRISYAVFRLKKKTDKRRTTTNQ